MNRVCYRVYDRKKNDEQGFWRHPIHYYRKISVVLAVLAMMSAAFGAFMDQFYGYHDILFPMLYFTVAAITFGSAIMFGVIIYALTADIQTINDNKEILEDLRKLFHKLNEQNPTLRWDISSDLLYFSIKRTDGKDGSDSEDSFE